MTFDSTKAPFPWFGGKSKCAPAVWAALGDCNHYVEPFAGSLAVLLNRPHAPNRAYYSETVNDLDGLLVNAWRSIQLSPEATAEACSWPVTELDLTSRHLSIVRWRAERDIERLAADPLWHDQRIAGWWLYGICAWIGGEWCSGTGPWHEVDGRIVRQGRAPRQPGVSAQLPHLNNNGKGVHSAGLREPEPNGMIMPRLLEWFRLLSARLRHVRIVNGPWERVCTRSAAQTLSCKTPGSCGIFFDPPYSFAERANGLYTVEDDCAAAVREWCKTAPPHWRVVLAGYDTEHTELEALGWRVVEWYKKGFLSGGYGNQGKGGDQQKRERLWLSPSCQVDSTVPQHGLDFGVSK